VFVCSCVRARLPTLSVPLTSSKPSTAGFLPEYTRVWDAQWQLVWCVLMVLSYACYLFVAIIIENSSIFEICNLTIFAVVLSLLNLIILCTIIAQFLTKYSLMDLESRSGSILDKSLNYSIDVLVLIFDKVYWQVSECVRRPLDFRM